MQIECYQPESYWNAAVKTEYGDISLMFRPSLDLVSSYLWDGTYGESHCNDAALAALVMGY